VYSRWWLNKNIMFLGIIHCPVFTVNTAFFIFQNTTFQRLDSVSLSPSSWEEVIVLIQFVIDTVCYYFVVGE
jgi:hypothetical protein